MEPIIKMLNQDISSLILGIFIIMSGVIASVTLIGRFSEIIGKPVKWIKKKNLDHELLLQTIQGLNILKDQHTESVKESIRHDEMIKDTVMKLSKTVDTLSKNLNEMRKEQDNDKLAEYKDRIGQSYRYYNERKLSDENQTPYWNHMEKEALEDLIKQYEAHGGKNSFVHSVVEAEIEKWKVID